MKTAFQGRFSPRGVSMGISYTIPFGATVEPITDSVSSGFDWSFLNPLLTTGISIWQQERAEDAAEAAKEAAEAQAALLRQQIEANQAAAVKSEELRTEGSQPSGQILGIPTNILLLAGAGVGVLALILILAKK